MVHWKEIGEKHNKLVETLRDKGIIEGSEAINLFTEDYVLQELKMRENESRNKE